MAEKKKYLWSKKAIASVLGVTREALKPEDLPEPVKIGGRFYYRLPDLEGKFPGLLGEPLESRLVGPAPGMEIPEKGKARRMERRNSMKGGA